MVDNLFYGEAPYPGLLKVINDKIYIEDIYGKERLRFINKYQTNLNKIEHNNYNDDNILSPVDLVNFLDYGVVRIISYEETIVKDKIKPNWNFKFINIKVIIGKNNKIVVIPNINSCGEYPRNNINVFINQLLPFLKNRYKNDDFTFILASYGDTTKTTLLYYEIENIDGEYSFDEPTDLEKIALKFECDKHDVEIHVDEQYRYIIS